MKVEVLQHTDRKLQLRVEETTLGAMNALRRTLMMELPKLAIEDVTIYDNRSALFDEIVAHRLGLLPVPTDAKKFAFRDACTCEGEGCANCTVLYTLTYEGPGTVYARDLQPASGEAELEIAEPEVPIVKLGQDQRIMLEATAVLGTGSDHAKWQPVVATGYREYPTVTGVEDIELSTEVRRDLERLAPPGAISFDGNEITLEDPIAGHDFLYNVSGRYEGLEALEFGSEPNVFLFEFETDGSLTAKEAFQGAINHLMDRLKDFEAAVDDL